MALQITTDHMTAVLRIAADLQAQIENGDFLPGDLLPGEVRIGERYGVSRHTAQRALVELEKADLVVCVHGRDGTSRPRRPQMFHRRPWMSAEVPVASEA